MWAEIRRKRSARRRPDSRGVVRRISISSASAGRPRGDASPKLADDDVVVVDKLPPHQAAIDDGLALPGSTHLWAGTGPRAGLNCRSDADDARRATRFRSSPRPHRPAGRRFELSTCRLRNVSRFHQLRHSRRRRPVEPPAVVKPAPAKPVMPCVAGRRRPPPPGWAPPAPGAAPSKCAARPLRPRQSHRPRRAARRPVMGVTASAPRAVPAKPVAPARAGPSWRPPPPKVEPPAWQAPRPVRPGA